MKYIVKVKVVLADDLEIFNLKMIVNVDDHLTLTKEQNNLALEAIEAIKRDQAKANKKLIQKAVFEKLEKVGLPARAIKVKSCISLKSQFIKTGLESEAENTESKVFFKFYDSLTPPQEEE